MVPVAEIAGPANEYNLNIPRYVDSSEPEDLHDLGAHLRGGIPDRDLDALDTYWTVFPSLRPGAVRRLTGGPAIALRARNAAGESHHPQAAEFKSYERRVAAIFDPWRNTHEQLLVGIEANALPERSSVPCPRTCWRASPTCRCSTGTMSTSGSWTTGTR